MNTNEKRKQGAINYWSDPSNRAAQRLRLNPHIQPPKPCECGCGQLTNWGKKFRWGHIMRVKSNLEKVHAKLKDVDVVGQKSKNLQKFWDAHPEMKAQRADRMRKNNPGKLAWEKSREKIKQGMKEHWNSSEGRLHAQQLSKLSQTPEARSKQKQSLKKWAVSEQGKKHLQEIGKSAWNEKNRAHTLETRVNGVHVQSSLEKLVPNLFPNARYTGNYSMWVKFKTAYKQWNPYDKKFEFILRKNPDFVLEPFEQTHTVIEVLGEWFHQLVEVDLLKKCYSEVGLNCITLWEKDLRSPTK